MTRMIERVTLIHGDVWNVNPIALKRIERLFCKNERAVIRTRLTTGDALTLVPVAAILVASIRLHFLDLVLNAQTPGPLVVPLRREREQGRGTRLVRARLDHHPARARSISNSATTSRMGHAFAPASALLRNPRA